MNTTRIFLATREIDECSAALKWLQEFGDGLDGRNPESASVIVRLNFGSACVGAREAEKMMSRFAQTSLSDLVAIAVSNCRNTIEINKQIIREEAANPENPQ